MNREAIEAALRTVKYPGFSRDIVSFGLVKEVTLGTDEISLQLLLTTNEPAIARQIQKECQEALKTAGWQKAVDVRIDIQAPAQAAGVQGPQSIDGVKHVIAVASGKGGVGKSTVAVNLAAALASQGLKVGLCDCDLYGPSVAHMFGSSERPTADEENTIIPIKINGLKLMSMGFLLEDGAPAVLRGPMVTRYTQQFLRQVKWQPLDVLLLDLPPGTGDIQLTIVQTVAMSGAIIVTTPQEVALIDARKAVGMFEKTNVQVLGIIENMSYFLCPGDGQSYPIFGSGGGEKEALRLKTQLLGQIPIEPEVCESGDAGSPVVIAHPDSAAAGVFNSIAGNLKSIL